MTCLVYTCINRIESITDITVCLYLSFSVNSNYFASGCRYPKTKSQLDRAAMLMYYACQ